MSLSHESLVDLYSLRLYLSHIMDKNEGMPGKMLYGMFIDMIECVVKREGEWDAFEGVVSEYATLEKLLKDNHANDVLRSIGVDPNDKERVTMAMSALYVYKRQLERRGSE